MLQLECAGGATPARREVEDGAVCSEPRVRFMDRHGNSGVGVNEKQRSDSAMWREFVEEVTISLLFYHSGFVLNVTRF